VVDRLTDASGILPYVYQRDGRPVPDLVRVGFLFQMAHRLVAAAVLGRTPGLGARAGKLVDPRPSERAGDEASLTSRLAAAGCASLNPVGDWRIPAVGRRRRVRATARAGTG
jgi:hypothetical protein